MAEKRMFAKKIVESDSFLDLPAMAQLLYFHLNMYADDDGFVNNAKRLQRMVGASEADLSVLLEKRFLLRFPNGVVVIKHWKMNNTIKGDRYRKTQYQEELACLRVKKNKAYTDDLNHPDAVLSAEDCMSCGSNLDPQDRSDQDNQEKMNFNQRKEEDIKDYISDSAYTKIIDCYHDRCPSFPRVRCLTDEKRNRITDCANTFSEMDIMKAFEMAEASTFLKNHDGEWIVDFDWIIKIDHMENILNGKYSNKKVPEISKRRIDPDEERAIQNMMQVDL